MKKLPKDYRESAYRSHRNAYWRIFRPRNRTPRDRSARNSRYSIHTAPEVFDVFGPERNKLISFLEEIRGKVCRGCRNIIIDFSMTKKFISGGAILFYAEIDRLLDLFPSLSIKCKPPYSARPSHVLKQIGFYKRIGKEVSLSICKDEDVVNWRVAKGQEVLGEKYDVILGKYDGVITEALQEELYAGLTEAMTNAHHHAYLRPRSDGINSPRSYKPWWMFSQEKEGILYVVFCDLGVGIPNSLPFSGDEGWRKWYQTLSRFNLHQNGDAELIRGAIRHSRTRTRQHNRGKGLTQIIETVSAVKDSGAIILSNRGWYQVKNGQETYDDFRRSINGTIISWHMPLVKE